MSIKNLIFVFAQSTEKIRDRFCWLFQEKEEIKELLFVYILLLLSIRRTDLIFCNINMST